MQCRIDDGQDDPRRACLAVQHRLGGHLHPGSGPHVLAGVQVATESREVAAGHLDPQAVGEIGALLDVTPPGKLVPVTRDTYSRLFELAGTLGLTEKDVQ